MRSFHRAISPMTALAVTGSTLFTDAGSKPPEVAVTGDDAEAGEPAGV